MISTREQNFHYELIHDGQQFWGCKYSMGRQLVGYQPKRASAFRAQQALKCLMIANPSDDLPQAEEEAVRLMQYLELSERGVHVYGVATGHQRPKSCCS